MALVAKKIVDKIEILMRAETVQVRTVTEIEEDGVVIARSNHRHVLRPGDDLTDQDANVRKHALALFPDWATRKPKERIKQK